MSITKLFKGWREIVRFSALRRAPRPYFSKQAGLRTCRNEGIRDNSRTPKYTFSLLRSFFARIRPLFSKQNIIYLHPRYVGRGRRAPLFSLLGFCLGIDFAQSSESSNAKEVGSAMTNIYIKNVFKDCKWEPQGLKMLPQSLKDLDINEISVIGNGCEGAVFEAKLKSSICALTDEPVDAGQDYNLAVKSVFNYYAESNASSILRKLNREVVPLQSCDSSSTEINDLIKNSVSRLPPHPNVVDMYCVFVDDMIVTEEGQQKFSAAMPQRVNPERCFARNKTLHLVMKRCTTELSEYLKEDPPMETRCLLLLQLLEAVCHLSSHGVAHRDIKADNILINLQQSRGTPHLQICDFGCCLAEESRSLKIPYVSGDVNIGGNSCLMAPEIACARPGEDSFLDFRKSDLWACGALAYQILGATNPFYRCESNTQLKSQTYKEVDLPPLPDDVPAAIKRLVESLLARDPAKRPSAAVAVLVVQLVMWNDFTSRNRKPPHHHAQLFKEMQQMELIWDEVLFLMRKLGSKTMVVSEDMTDISKYFCLSRLTHSKFLKALKFFQ